MGAANAQQLVARAADMQFVLGQALLRAQEGGGPWQGLRADAVGVAGHSFGAQTVQALAGMRYPLPAPGLADPRPRAFIAFSPGLAAGRMSAAEQMGAITRPFLCITGTEDGDPLGRHQDPDFRRAAYDGLPAGAKAELCLDQADHMTFAGNAERRINGRGPFARRPEVAALEDRHHALVAAITTLWWRARLLGDAQAAERLRSPAGLGPQDQWRSG
jgi:predicted dienelactone hydrolase